MNKIEKSAFLLNEGQLAYGVEIMEKYFLTMNYTAYQQKLTLVVCSNHMIHNLHERRPVSCVRLYKKIKNVFDDFVKACDCDNGPVSDEHMAIFGLMIATFKTTVIDVPSKIKGKEAIQHYVEDLYSAQYKKLLKG